eukprot:COSAG04_NODE_19959_length_404_cov_0.793443_1_plen_134_part_11
MASNGTVPIGADVILTPATLPFNRSSWNDTQLVSLAAVDDNIDEGDGYFISVSHRAISDDPLYTSALTEQMAYILDNDVAGMVMSESELTVTEGRASVASYAFTLQSQPIASVVVSVEPSDGITVSATSLTFEP